MVSDFTEQQGRILRLILRLSWGCQKKWAYIPHQSDFEMVRVGQGKVKAHLDWLINARVIFRQGDYYAFNKDFDQWRVSRALSYTPEKMTELVHRNLEDKGSPELTEKVRNGEENLTEKVRPPTEELTEKVRDALPKREGFPYLKGKTSTPDLATAKDSKDNINSIPPVVDDKTGEVFRFYEQEMGHVLTPTIAEGIKGWLEEHPPERVKEAIRRAVLQGVRKPSYVNGILENWRTNGYDSERRDERRGYGQPGAYRTNNSPPGGRLKTTAELAADNEQWLRAHGR